MTDEEFMKDPNHWPLWPFLPLKNKNFVFPRFAVLYHGDNDEFFLYEDVSLDEKGSIRGKVPNWVGTTNDLHEIIERGWVVD